MAFILTDDGTLDTVLRCEDCGEEVRYHYDPETDDYPAGDDATDAYKTFVKWAIEDAESEHECEPDEDADEPDEGAITTTDHETFYQYGKRVLWRRSKNDSRWWYVSRPLTDVFLGDFGDCESALRAYMDRVRFWPDVWFISDHGNAHRIDLSEQE